MSKSLLPPADIPFSGEGYRYWKLAEKRREHIVQLQRLIEIKDAQLRKYEGAEGVRVGVMGE